MANTYSLVLLGKDYNDSVDKIMSLYEKTIYLGEVDSPFHLEIASYARIGVATYIPRNLNNMFCAPNKIYEYTGFGIPVLCNDVPGLISTIGISRAGLCIDFDSSDCILGAIREIDAHYGQFEEAATKFYESTNNENTMKQIIDDLCIDSELYTTHRN